MKNILFLLFILFSFISISQKEIKNDTNEICFPSKVGKQILIDLNELDKLRTTDKLTKTEIIELEKKVVKQDSMISKLEQKDVNNLLIVKSVEEKFKLVEEDNKDLRGRIKTLGIKNNIIEIVTGAIMASIIYIQIFK